MIEFDRSAFSDTVQLNGRIVRDPQEGDQVFSIALQHDEIELHGRISFIGFSESHRQRVKKDAAVICEIGLAGGLVSIDNVCAVEVLSTDDRQELPLDFTSTYL